MAVYFFRNHFYIHRVSTEFDMDGPSGVALKTMSFEGGNLNYTALTALETIKLPTTGVDSSFIGSFPAPWIEQKKPRIRSQADPFTFCVIFYSVHNVMAVGYYNSIRRLPAVLSQVI